MPDIACVFHAGRVDISVAPDRRRRRPQEFFIKFLSSLYVNQRRFCTRTTEPEHAANTTARPFTYARAAVAVWAPFYYISFVSCRRAVRRRGRGLYINALQSDGEEGFPVCVCRV